MRSPDGSPPATTRPHRAVDAPRAGRTAAHRRGGRGRRLGARPGRDRRPGRVRRLRTARRRAVRRVRGAAGRAAVALRGRRRPPRPAGTRAAAGVDAHRVHRSGARARRRVEGPRPRSTSRPGSPPPSLRPRATSPRCSPPGSPVARIPCSAPRPPTCPPSRPGGPARLRSGSSRRRRRRRPDDGAAPTSSARSPPRWRAGCAEAGVRRSRCPCSRSGAGRATRWASAPGTAAATCGGACTSGGRRTSHLVVARWCSSTTS